MSPRIMEGSNFFEEQRKIPQDLHGNGSCHYAGPEPTSLWIWTLDNVAVSGLIVRSFIYQFICSTNLLLIYDPTWFWSFSCSDVQGSLDEKMNSQDKKFSDTFS